MKTSPLMVTLLCFCCIFWEFVSASSTNITTTKFLSDPESLVSSNSQFRVGFFSPANSMNRYVGIWYDIKDSDTKEVVWVANRNSPMKDSSGVLKISEDGNLQLTDGQDMIVWSSNVSHPTNSTVVARLLDTGNLVLLSSNSRMPVWQSFEHLTNSLLPQTRISIDTDNVDENYTILHSWKSLSDPSIGRFRIEVVPHAQPEYVTWDGDQPYWRSGPWNGNMFLGVPYEVTEATYGFRIINNEHEGTLDILYYEADKSLLIYYALNYDGNVVLKYWSSDSRKWIIAWQSFESECDYYGKCGPFGSCNPKDSSICSCLKGFEPRNTDGWNEGDWTSGCVRRTPLQCGKSRGKVDGFLKLKHMKVPDYAGFILADDQDDCRKKCIENCLCLAYAFPKGIGCMIWNGSLIDLQQFSGDGTDLFIRLANSELDERRYLKLVIAAIAIVCAAALCVFLYYLWRWRCQRNDKKTTNQEANNRIDPIIDQGEFKDLALFKFQELQGSTTNFSALNKLGEGGFGPVYKGKFENGQEIAVKRLSRASGQGLQEFMNEVLLISKLQHRNLVRLFGCCVEEEEKLLVYEYLPNGSLDALLFDPHHGKQLDWKRRFNIIDGICRGLLYLHRDSRLKIIHRDLKSSNILLDEDLNPKISDFGMARIFEAKQDQANTIRVVGTYGYMSPEYAMEGYFSEKSDIFSLGVLLLEIVSGRKNSSFRHHDTLSLLTYAWKLWNEKDMLSLIDPTIFDLSVEDEILKCIHLGLLCVQELPEDRPTISGLISMLDVNNATNLPRPKQPGFTLRKILSSNESQNTQSSQDSSRNQVSLTVVSGR